MTEVGIRLVELTRVFEGRPAVDAVDLEVYEGEFFSLIGPSGCGKTTTLRMIAGLETVTSGQVMLGDRDVTLEPAYKRPINTVFQQYGLFPHLNIFENVAFGLRERREPRAGVTAAVERMLGLVGLAGRERSRPRQLSGGEQQRVALARALVLNPKVLLLDEPLGALDLKLRRQMQVLLKGLQRELGITFVYVTHDQEEAFGMSDRVAVMNKGKLEQVGAPYDVYHRPSTFFVADFVGASNCLQGAVRAVQASGQYTVELASSDTVFTAYGVPGLAAGARVAALARPEAGCIDEDRSDCVRTAGAIKDVAYSGPQISYTVDSNGFGDLTVLAKTDTRSRLLPVGRHVELAWDIADVWILPLGDAPPDAPPDAPRDGSGNARGSQATEQKPSQSRV